MAQLRSLIFRTCSCLIPFNWENTQEKKELKIVFLVFFLFFFVK